MRLNDIRQSMNLPLQARRSTLSTTLLFSPLRWVFMYPHVIFPLHPRYSWVDHVFTCWGSHWHWVKCEHAHGGVRSHLSGQPSTFFPLLRWVFIYIHLHGSQCMHILGWHYVYMLGNLHLVARRLSFRSTCWCTWLLWQKVVAKSILESSEVIYYKILVVPGFYFNNIHQFFDKF